MTAFSDSHRRHLRRTKPRPAHGSEDKSLFGQLILPNHPGIPQHQRVGLAPAALLLVACAAWQDSSVMRPLTEASSTALAGHFLASGAPAIPPSAAPGPSPRPECHSRPLAQMQHEDGRVYGHGHGCSLSGAVLRPATRILGLAKYPIQPLLEVLWAAALASGRR